MRWIGASTSPIASACDLHLGAPRDLAHEHADEVRVMPPRAQDDRGDLAQLLARRAARLLDAADRLQQPLPRLREHRLEQRRLRREVVVHEPVGDAGLRGHVPDPGRVVPVAGEHTHGGLEDLPALLAD